jgi:hypothetical protein
MTTLDGRTRGRGRGAALLLEHCAYFDRLYEDRMPARERLEREVGRDLGHVLVTALARNGCKGRPPPV